MVLPLKTLKGLVWVQPGWQVFHKLPGRSDRQPEQRTQQDGASLLTVLCQLRSWEEMSTRPTTSWGVCRSCTTTGSPTSLCQMTSRESVPFWNGCHIYRRCAVPWQPGAWEPVGLGSWWWGGWGKEHHPCPLFDTQPCPLLLGSL